MAKSIMVQGTMSGVGKSMLTAALCRIFRQDGYRTAPFKSQNMALNSFVTGDGLEMGRAQAVQAYAAGKEPDVRMNPILLKPESETGSQVIVNGRIFGNYQAADYFRIKKQLVPVILEAYESLAAENDLIVIEGAGSPAEINLKKDDIVNMGLAAMVDAKVLLVGDINPGGVFGQLYGTFMLLPPVERERVAGFIMNKFRGDVTLLEPGLSELTALTGIPVLGVVPYTDIGLLQEDSLSEELLQETHGKPIDIAVIRLPYISNYTDFTPLLASGQMGIRYVRTPKELGRPDLLIIPGSKSTMADLRWLRDSGLARSVLALSENGTDIFGICGGYQMLGLSLYDPQTGEREEGLSLLPVDTVFQKEKTTELSEGTILAPPFQGTAIRGYEIHTGQTELSDRAEKDGTKPVLSLQTADGVRQDGFYRNNIFGTYLHGIFENGAFVRKMEELYLKRRGLWTESSDLSATGALDFRDSQEAALEALAADVRKSLCMEKIYQAAGLQGEGS
ncbi:MAG: cobyric acid synthase [Lachnospiraceae bacterium]|nr:cobyric acid synthase [Lachnospiraceae bacterium]